VTVKIAVVTAIVLWAVIGDMRTGYIRNLLTMPALAAGIIWTGCDGPWWYGLAGAVLGMGFFYPLWAIGKFGAGDAKLMGVVGAFGGLRFAFWALAFTLAAGTFFSLLKLLQQRRAGATLKRMGMGLLTQTLTTGTIDSSDQRERYPFSLAIAAGSLLTLLVMRYSLLQLPW